MVVQKFNSRDRARVVALLEDRYVSQLKPTHGLQKYFVDENNRRYLILGAIGDWHGIPARVVAIERAIAQADLQAADRGILIIARKLKDRIRLFRGGLKEFVACSDRFVRTQTGEYHIDTTEIGKKLTVVQAPRYVLDHLVDIPLLA